MLVTGGNRSIGLDACRQLAMVGLRVLLTDRDTEKGEEAAQKLRNEALNVSFDARSVEDCDRDHAPVCLRFNRPSPGRL